MKRLLTVCTYTLGIAIPSAGVCALTPIQLDGFNRDVIVEVGSSGPFYTTAMSFDWGIIDPSDNNALYEQGLVDSRFGLLPRGLPSDGMIVVPIIETVFQLEPYNQPNSVRLGGGISSAELTVGIADQTRFSHLAVLAASGNTFGLRTDLLTLRFHDGHTRTVGIQTDDWFRGTENIAIRGFGRVSLHAGGDDSGANNPRLYHTVVPLTLEEQTKQLVGFRFSQPTPESTRFPNLLAISGNRLPSAGIQVFPTVELFPDSQAWRVIAPDNMKAAVVLDGSLSTDQDGDALQYAWSYWPETEVFSTDETVLLELPVGEHQFQLEVDDGWGQGVATATVQVIPPAFAIELLAERLKEAQLGNSIERALIAIFAAAHQSMERGAFGAGIQQLRAWQNLIQVKIDIRDAALAEELVAGAEQIIQSLGNH